MNYLLFYQINYHYNGVIEYDPSAAVTYHRNPQDWKYVFLPLAVLVTVLTSEMANWVTTLYSVG